MGFAEDLKTASKLSEGRLDEKPSDCKHCSPVSVGVFGTHYACMNEKHRGYGMQPPFCIECEKYEKEDVKTMQTGKNEW